MKIFGLEIGGSKKQVVEDQIPEIQADIPATKNPAAVKKMRNPVINYHSQRVRGRGAFNPSEYDLAEIGRIEDTDSYVSQAFDKKVGLMFKEGWDLVGKNPRTVRYVKQRFAQIAMASGMPTNELMRNIGSSMVRKSNSFLVKVRNTNASGGRVRSMPGGGRTLKPVAAYFPVPAETMQFELTSNRISKWRQKMPNGEYQEFRVDDVVHAYHRKKDGFIFGTPTLIPVIDDIRALRKIEENIELLVYQHLFPLFQYKVGTENNPAGITETGESEIDVVRREIQFMPTEGGIVTPERHEIKAVGAEGRAIRAEGYLDHFKKRVFSGLGVSAVDMGEGETANRATADNMSRNLVDAVKDLQQVVEDCVNKHIIEELLLESTFGEEVLNEENAVRLKFKEVDVEAQIKKENHSADLFTKNAITHDEARRRIGEEPIVMPTSEESQSGEDLGERYPEWSKLQWSMIQRPTLLIQSIDEPYSPQAIAAARDNSTEITPGDLDESERRRTERETAVAQSRGPAERSTQDNFIEQTFVATKKDVISRCSKSNKLEHDWVATLVRTQMNTVVDKLVAQQLLAFRKGYAKHRRIDDEAFVSTSIAVRSQLRQRAEHYVTKLSNDVVSGLRRNVDNLEPDTVVRSAAATLESYQYRTRFIEDVEIRKAETYGEILAYRNNGQINVVISAKSGTSSTIAQSKDGQVLNTSFVSLEDVPPFHANDTTKIQIQNEAIDDPTPYVKENSVAECPKCGKTAMLKKDTPDIYNCRGCGHSFRKITPLGGGQMPPDLAEEEMQDQNLSGKLGPKSKTTAVTNCKNRAKARLRSRHPDWSEDQITFAAEAACEHLFDMMEEEGENVDESLEDATLEECVLSTKKSLRKQNPSWSEDRIKSAAFAICNSRK